MTEIEKLSLMIYNELIKDVKNVSYNIFPNLIVRSEDLLYIQLKYKEVYGKSIDSFLCYLIWKLLSEDVCASWLMYSDFLLEDFYNKIEYLLYKMSGNELNILDEIYFEKFEYLEEDLWN